MRVLRSLFVFATLLMLFFLFLFRASPVVSGARLGLSLFFETLFPALFPFLVLSELILSCGAGHLLASLLSRPLGALFGVSEAGGEALVLGTLCGQPVASSSAVSLFERGEITRDEARRISLFANNPGAGFLIVATGSALFGNTGAGTALFCITQLSALLLGITMRILLGKAEQTGKKCHNGMNKSPFFTLFTQAVQRAFACVLQVGAFLVFFSALSCALSDLLKSMPLDKRWHAWLFGSLEITAGIRSAVATLSPYTAFRLAAFLCGFGGLCVCMQILSITQKCELSVWHYLLAKVFQGGIALLLCEGYLRLFHPALSPVQSAPTIAFSARFPVIAALLVLLVLGLLLKKPPCIGKRAGKFQSPNKKGKEI